MGVHLAREDPADILNGRPPVTDSVLSFVTGTELRSILPDLTLHVFGANSEQGVAGRGKGQLLELYAETNSLEPLFVMAQGETGLQLRDWESRCQPSKCANTVYLGESSCGGEVMPDQDWADWQQVPDGCGSHSTGACGCILARVAQPTNASRCSRKNGRSICSESSSRSPGVTPTSRKCFCQPATT